MMKGPGAKSHITNGVTASSYMVKYLRISSYFKSVKVGPPVHNYEHEAGSYGDGFT